MFSNPTNAPIRSNASGSITAYQRGVHAFDHKCKTPPLNPFAPGTTDHQQWQEGHDFAELTFNSPW